MIEGGIRVASWIPPGTFGTLPGCLAFILVQPDQKLYVLYQLKTGGPFLLSDSVYLTGLSFISGAAHFVFSNTKCYILTFTSSTKLCTIELEINVTNGFVKEQKPVVECTWKTPIQSSSSTKVVLWNECIFLLGGIGSKSFEVKRIEGNTTVSEVSIPMDKVIQEILFRDGVAHVIIGSNEACKIFYLISLGEKESFTILLDHDERLSMGLKGNDTLKGGNSSTSSSSCLSANGTCIIHSSTDGGSIFWSFIVTNWSEGREELQQNLTRALFNGHSVIDIVTTLWNVEIPLVELSRFLADLVLELSALRKAHLMGLLVSILFKWPDLTNHWLFSNIYWRINHFWEAAISTSVDLGQALNSLENPDDEVKVLLQASLMPSVTDLAIEAIEWLVYLFGVEEKEMASVRTRALRVASINHRLTSVIVLIKAVHSSLLNAVEKHKGEGMAPLFVYYRSFLLKLETAMDSLDFTATLLYLKDSRQSATRKLEFLFAGDDDDVTLGNTLQLLANNFSKVYNNHHHHHRRRQDGIIFTRRRDVISGQSLPSNTDSIQTCPGCAWPFLDPSIHQLDYPVKPFWHSHWSNCCPCGNTSFSL